MEINVEGCRVYYDVKGKGPPLVIPGSASTSLFDTNVSLFGSEYTVISLDIRGAGGRTIPPSGAYTIEDMADDVAGVMRALGYERASYLGFGNGGMIGQVLAVRHPDMIDRLVLTMTTPSPETQTSNATDDHSVVSDPTALMAAALAGDRTALRQIAEITLSPSFSEEHPDVADQLVEEFFAPIFSQSAEDCSRFWSALGSMPPVSRLGEIRSPTLIVTSSGDRMVAPSDSWRMWQSIPNAVIVGLNSIGHNWYSEVPQLMTGIIKSFLQGDMDMKKSIRTAHE